MPSMKSLARDTAIYGLSSILGRFLNYMLVPLYTHYMPAASGDYGITTNMYAYTALALIILTFGMETTLFRFANEGRSKPDTVFSTAIVLVASLVALFLAAVFIFITPISTALGYAATPSYIEMMATVVALDALQAIPFSYLRFQKRPIRFATLKLLFIVINIGLNIVYFVWLGKTSAFYVFFINLLTTSFITLLFLPGLLRIEWKFDVSLLKTMLGYTWPIVILGIAGILGQVSDKIIFPLVYPDKAQANVELGIYGGCVKIAMIMAMITQAFRYAYEPIVFAKRKDNDQKEYNATAMKYFIIFTLLAFLCVMGWLPILQHIVGKDYQQGMAVVPIVMVAEILMGIYFNLSFWYKLTDKTYFGALFSIAGCAVTIAANVLFIPQFSYTACAWGAVAGYATMMTLSYVVGQTFYPVNYPIRSIAWYVLITAVSWMSMDYFADILPTWASLIYNTLVILFYCSMIIQMGDLNLAALPVIGRYFRKKQ